MDLKQSMAGTAIVTHYLEPFDKHKKYYDFMARAFDASTDYDDSSSECLPDDIECQNYAYLSKTDQDCVNSGKTGTPIDAVTNPIGQFLCVQGKGATKYATGTGGSGPGGINVGGIGTLGLIAIVVIVIILIKR